MTIQQDRHRKTVDTIYRVTAQRDLCLGKLVRLEGQLQKLRKQVARQSKAMAKPQPVTAHTVMPTGIATVALSVAPQQSPPPDDLNDAIPAFLDRRNLIADPKTKDRNAERRVIEKEKREAKLTGKTKAMPLTGRAALDHILGG